MHLFCSCLGIYVCCCLCSTDFLIEFSCGETLNPKVCGLGLKVYRTTYENNNNIPWDLTLPSPKSSLKTRTTHEKRDHQQRQQQPRQSRANTNKSHHEDRPAWSFLRASWPKLVISSGALLAWFAGFLRGFGWRVCLEKRLPDQVKRGKGSGSGPVWRGCIGWKLSIHTFLLPVSFVLQMRTAALEIKASLKRDNNAFFTPFTSSKYLKARMDLYTQIAERQQSIGHLP